VEVPLRTKREGGNPRGKGAKQESAFGHLQSSEESPSQTGPAALGSQARPLEQPRSP
jgi:hypothetical protein